MHPDDKILKFTNDFFRFPLVPECFLVFLLGWFNFRKIEKLNFLIDFEHDLELEC